MTDPIRSVKQLLQENYYIPAYQRGYRWTERQVVDLLNDINEFTPDKANGQTWYCIQPLVVRKTSVPNHGEVYELIDGQQRLTTIFLINHYFKEIKVPSEHVSQAEPKIIYETREKSFSFLQDLSLGNKNEEKNKNNEENNKKNIDFHHISQAYYAIDQWKEKISADFVSKFYHSTKVIWYEAPDHGDPLHDSVAIFSRLNIGKIPLTDAELIKALFISESNFTSGELSEADKRKQLEIALQWDRIESELHNDLLWYFLAPYSYKPENRIELIFKLLIDEPNKNESHDVFRKFKDKYEESGNKALWDKVVDTFETLKEWSLSRKLYHKIGYLIATGTEIKIILKLSQVENKSEFIKELDKLISKKLPKKDLDELHYGDRDDIKNIKNILLLHNVQTLLGGEEDKPFFSFTRYKKEKWDVEHIHSQTDPDAFPEKGTDQREWLKESLEYVDDTLQKELRGFLDEREKESWQEEFFEHANRVLKHLAGNDPEEGKNGLGNLALLDSSTNCSYKNAIFPVKRREIIEREKNGTFVPLCTKNVFMKLYTGKTNFKFWGLADREAYMKDIKEKLKSYISKGDK